VPDDKRTDTGGGARIGDSVNTGGGNFVGRDQVTVGGIAGGEGIAIGHEALAVVDRRVIVNNILKVDTQALDLMLQIVVAALGGDRSALQRLGASSVSEQGSRQIAELIAAQKQAAAQGLPVTPHALYRLGVLANYRRDYEEALAYFRQATQADPEYSDAFEAIARVQQYGALGDISQNCYDDARLRLSEAREAALQVEPLAASLVLCGYIEQTQAKLALQKRSQADWLRHLQEAARLFERAAQLEPNDPSVHNGLGDIQLALGNLDAAIVAFNRAIALAPKYTAAYNDLAVACEGKLQDDPAHAADWYHKALDAWRATFHLAPNDPGFSANEVLAIGQHIVRLEGQAGQYESRKDTTMSDEKKIDTGGGAYIGGSVDTGGGKFVGRDDYSTTGASADESASARFSPLAQQLYSLLKDKWFSLSELQDLSFTLDLDWDKLSGNDKTDKARALVLECERSNRLEQLRRLMRLARPQLKDQLDETPTDH